MLTSKFRYCSLASYFFLPYIYAFSQFGGYHLSTAKDHNEICFSDNDCNIKKFLTCDLFTNKCVCPPNNFVYDPQHQKCSLLAKRRCHLGHHKTPEISSIHPVCNSNSECISSRCECKSGYTLNPKTFICVGKFGTKCTNGTLQSPCDQKLGLTCIDNKCQCENSTLEFKPMIGCANLNSEYFTQMRKVVDIAELLVRIDRELSTSQSENKSEKIVKRQINQQFSDAVGIPGSNQNALTPNEFAQTNTNTASQQQPPSLFGFLNLLTPFLNAISQPQQQNSLFSDQNQLQRQTTDAVSPPTNRNTRPTLLTMLLDFLGILGRLWPQFRDFKLNIFSFFRQFRSIITPAATHQSQVAKPAVSSSATQEPIFRETSNNAIGENSNNFQNSLGTSRNVNNNNNGFKPFQLFPLNFNSQPRRLFARHLMDNKDASSEIASKRMDAVRPITDEIDDTPEIKI